MPYGASGRPLASGLRYNQRKAIDTTSEQLQRVRDMVYHLSESLGENEWVYLVFIIIVK